MRFLNFYQHFILILLSCFISVQISLAQKVGVVLSGGGADGEVRWRPMMVVLVLVAVAVGLMQFGGGAGQLPKGHVMGFYG